jgi:hypothetical protein
MDTSELSADIWTFSLPAENALLQRLEREHVALREVSDDSIFQGVTTGADKIFRCDDVGPDPTDPARRLVRPHSLGRADAPIAIEREYLRPVYAGRGDLRRFITRPSSEWLILPYQRTVSGRYQLVDLAQLDSSAPQLAAWLRAHEQELRERAGVDSVWHGYSYRKNLERFDVDAKIMVPYMVENLCAVFDPDHHFFVNVSTGGYGVGRAQRFETDWSYLAALLNSTLLSWALRRYSRAWRGGWFAARKGNLEKLPIAIVDATTQRQIVGLYDDCRAAAARLGGTRRGSADEAMAQRLLGARTEAFDRAVYGAYGVTEAELDVIRNVQPTEGEVEDEAV